MAYRSSQKRDDELINSFMGYMLTHPEEDPFSSKYNPPVSYSTSTGGISIEPIIGWLFIAAIAFIAIASPVFSVILLFVDIHYEDLWVFLLITIADIGWLIWYLFFKKKKGTKEEK